MQVEAKKIRSGSRGRRQPYDKRPNRRRFVLTGCSRETIRPFKSVRAFDTHLPALGRPRSGDGNTPVALPISEGVLHVHCDLTAQIGIPEILQLNCDWHRLTILSKTDCPLAVQTGQGRTGWAWRRKMNQLIHKTC